MPTIPDGQAFGSRATPVSRRGANVADFSRSEAVIGDSLNRLATTVSRTAQERNQKRSQLEYAKAKSAAAISSLEIENSFLQDDDHDTFDLRYDSQINEAHNKILEGISDPQLKALFGEELQLGRAKGRARIRELAQSKFKDAELGALVTDQAALKDTYIRGNPETRAEVMESLALRLESLVDLQVLSKEEAAVQSENIATQFSIALIESQDPRDQLEMLNQPDVKAQMPADVHAKLLRRADDSSVLAESFDATDEIMRTHPDDPKAALAAARKIEDAKVRAETTRQVGARISANQTIENQEIAEGYVEAYTAVEQAVPLAQWASDNQALWDKMSPAQRENLKGVAEGKDAKTDLAAYAEVNTLQREEGPDDARRFLHKNVNRFTPTDFKKLDDRLNNDVPDESSEGYLTDTQRLNKYSEGLSKEKQGELALAYEAMVARHVSEFEKPPTFREKNEFITQLIEEDDGGWFGSAFRQFEKLPEFNLKKNREILDRNMREAEASKGGPLTESEQILLYQLLRERNMLLDDTGAEQ